MLTIMRITFLECIRKKVFVLSVLLMVLYLALCGFGLHSAYSSNAANMMNGQLDTLMASLLTPVFTLSSMLIIFLVVLSSAGIISSEIENGIIQPILTRPISRYTVILGKFFGISLMIIIFSFVMFYSILLMNTLFSGVPLSKFGYGNIMGASLLYVLQPLILLSISLRFGINLATMANGVIMVVFYIISSMGAMIERIGVMLDSYAMVNSGIISSLVCPMDAVNRKFGSLLFAHLNNQFGILSNMGGAISEPSAIMIVYAVLFIVFMVFWACRSFAKRSI